MTGICGIYCPGDPARVSHRALGRMLDALAHRGRAARRTVREGDGLAMGLAHELRDRAPVGESAPGWYEDDGQAAALDGVVFNAAALLGTPRDKAEPSASYAAAALAQLARAPESFPRGLDGPFALAVWRGASRELVLARDPLGRRPLYYLHRPDLGLVAFASELKGVLAHPAARRRLNREALSAYLSFGYVPAPLCIFEDIHKVFPGERVMVDARARTTTRQYAGLPRFQPQDDALETCATMLRDEVIRSVAKHLVGVSPVGLYCSGGLDSTILLAVLAELGVEDVHTFTLGFHTDGREHLFADLEWGARVARRFGSEHHQVIIPRGHDPGPLLPRIVRQLDEPMLTPNAYSKYLLAEAARSHGVTTCLSGSNGEYLFERLPAKKFQKMRRTVRPDATLEDLLLCFQVKFLSFAEQRELLVDPLDDPEAVARRIQERHLRDITASDPSDMLHAVCVRLQAAEKTTTVLDRTGALSGVGVRLPYHDIDLLVAANRIPARFKGSEHKGQHKEVAKRAFAHMLPPGVVSRPKVGYPSYYWTQGEIAGFEPRLLARHAGLFRPQAVEKLVAADRASDGRSRGRCTWGLLVLQAWLEHNVEGCEHPVTA